jgi:hypothetical protein
MMKGKDHRQDAGATVGGHIGPPLREPASIISFAIDRAIREQPEEAGRQMLALMRENARLEGEVARLQARWGRRV